jgi:uncharacterized protein (DUF2141 family)
VTSRFFIITAFVLLQGVPLGAVTATGADLTGTLVVRVQGLQSDDGNLRFALFDSEKDFLKHPVRAGIVEIRNQQGAWTIEQLPHGTYAVLVHHDINANGMMERHWYGKPKEPTGSSNDAPARFGRPTFENAKFRFEASALTLTVTVK